MQSTRRSNSNSGKVVLVKNNTLELEKSSEVPFPFSFWGKHPFNRGGRANSVWPPPAAQSSVPQRQLTAFLPRLIPERSFFLRILPPHAALHHPQYLITVPFSVATQNTLYSLSSITSRLWLLGWDFSAPQQRLQENPILYLWLS